jgi:hypothetical protein
VRRKPVDASRAFCRCVHASATHASATGDVSARVRASACQKRRTSAPNRADVGGPHQRGVLYRADDRASAPPPRWHGVVHAAWLRALHAPSRLLRNLLCSFCCAMHQARRTLPFGPLGSVQASSTLPQGSLACRSPYSNAYRPVSHNHTPTCPLSSTRGHSIQSPPVRADCRASLRCRCSARACCLEFMVGPMRQPSPHLSLSTPTPSPANPPGAPSAAVTPHGASCAIWPP